MRSIYTAWESGNFSSAAWAHPEIEYVTAEGPDAGTSTGLSGMAQNFREFLGVWHEWHVVAEEYREVDDGRVLVPYHFTARGKTSGIEVGQVRARGVSLFCVRDGEVTRLVQYFDRDRALADLGLKE